MARSTHKKAIRTLKRARPRGRPLRKWMREAARGSAPWSTFARRWLDNKGLR